MVVTFGNTSNAQKFYPRESCQRFQHQVKAVAALIQCCRPIIPLPIKAEQELVCCPTSFVRSGVWRYDHWLGLAVAVHWVVGVTVAVHSVLWFEFRASWTWQTKNISSWWSYSHTNSFLKWGDHSELFKSTMTCLSPYLGFGWRRRP